MAGSGLRADLMAIDRRQRVAALAVAAVVVALDQALKAFALSRLGVEGATLPLPGPVDLTLTFNHSNAFGMAPQVGEVTRWGLAALNLLVAAVLVVFVTRRFPRGLTAAGMAFIIGGAVGNAVDRFRYGAVVDFFDASKIGFHWIFNLADASLDLGIGLCILAAFLPARRPAAV